MGFCALNEDCINTLTNPFELSELFGLYRHWGHPTVDLQKGCQKVQEVAKKKKVVDPITTNQVVGCFKRYFVQSYITKHGHWPDVRRELIPIHSKLRLALEAGVTDFSEYHEQIPIEEWADPCFNKLFEFDYYEDWSQLIEDKAIAPYLSDWKSIYDKNLLGFIPDESIRNSRRVIIECLTKEK